jgi:hypothetical protein
VLLPVAPKKITEEGDGMPQGGAMGVAVWYDAMVWGWRRVAVESRKRLKVEDE